MTVPCRSIAMLVVSVIAAVPPLAAQDNKTMPVPVVEVSAGYAWLRNTTSSATYPGGWYFSTVGNVTQWFGVVAEAAGSYRSENSTYMAGTRTLSEKAQVYTFLGGGRFFHKAGRFMPFGQMLAGVAMHRLQQTETIMAGSPVTGVSHWTPSSTKLALQPGGGVTVYLTERVGIRTAVDYCVTIDENDDDTRQEVRFLSGFTLRWGSR